MTLMSTEPETDSSTPASRPLARELRELTTAVRVSFHWLGTSRTLTHSQKAQAAEPFGAAEKFLSAGKKLFDTSAPAYRNVTAVRSKIIQYWKSTSLPFPEPGLRLIRKERINAFDAQLEAFREELDRAVRELDVEFDDLKRQARQRLGSLFDPSDYPTALRHEFGVEWDYPSVAPPEHLQSIAPELYERECARVSARFEEAIQLAETAFLDEFNSLVSHLCERISGSGDQGPKVFRDSAVSRLHEFFQRFKELQIGSHDQLETLVEQAQGLLKGVSPQALRDQPSLRQQLSRQMGAVQSQLDQLLVDRPRRSIVRPRSSEEA